MTVNRATTTAFLAFGWLLLVLPGKGAAQTQAPARRYEPYVSLGWLRFGNFFQVSDSQVAAGQPADDIWALGAEAGLVFAPNPQGPLRLYGSVDYVSYGGFDTATEFDPSFGVAAGVRREARPHSFDLSAQYQGGRPSREVGDQLDRANVSAVVAEYSYRLSHDLEISALADLRHESHEEAPDRANTVRELGAAVRYRGFGSRFSPEVGARLADRSAENPNEELSQRELFLRLRFIPADPAYITLRVRHRRREYTTTDPGARNFDRVDTRWQLAVSGDYRWSRHLGLRAYYALEDSSSPQPSGEFSTSLLSLGFVVRF